MLDHVKKRESFRVLSEFMAIERRLCDILYEKRPFSISRMECASCRMMHYIFHSDGRVHKRAGQRRIRRALQAAASARAVLRRLRKIPEATVLIGAALEVHERLVAAFNAELVQ